VQQRAPEDLQVEREQEDIPIQVTVDEQMMTIISDMHRNKTNESDDERKNTHEIQTSQNPVQILEIEHPQDEESEIIDEREPLVLEVYQNHSRKWKSQAGRKKARMKVRKPTWKNYSSFRRSTTTPAKCSLDQLNRLSSRIGVRGCRPLQQSAWA
jgi:hypothetical protein